MDDIWINPAGELIIVDYKATSKDSEITIDAEWQNSYKRQMEIYQWLFAKNDFKVSRTGYFVYCNGKRDREAFDAKLEFDIKLIPYQGDDSWIAPALNEIRKYLMQSTPPLSSAQCEYCEYVEAVQQVAPHTPALKKTLF